MKLFGGQRKEEPPRRRATGQLEEESIRFRRSATLTGSLSDEVIASAEDRGRLQSARVEGQAKRKKQRRFIRRIGFLAGLVVLLLIALLNRASSFDVQFANSPSRLPSITPYRETAKQYTGSNFGNQFSPTLHAAGLSAYLTGRHKEIAAVRVERHLFDVSPKLIVTLRKPVLMWQTKNDARAFYVDAAGTSFSFNGYGNDTQLVRVNDESGVPAELGVPVASSRQISFLGQLVGQVAQTSKGKLAITKIVFPPSSTKEINVFLKDREYFGKVYLERSARAQGDELVRGVTHLEAQTKAPTEYIDVRIAERVFYK